MSKEEVFTHISSDPEIMHGKPCIKGTRIPVWLIVGMLGDGMSEDEILKQYPSLTATDIKAALKYASYAADFERIAL
jgi:uncharacterized protein (DUF433 family)